MLTIIRSLSGAVARRLRGRGRDHLVCQRCPAPIAWDTARVRPSGELGTFELVCPACTAGGPRAADWFALRSAGHEDGRERTHAGLTAAGWFWSVYLAVLLVIAGLALAAPA